MKRKVICFLLFCSCLSVLYAGCTPPSGNSELVVEAAEIVDISLGITTEGVVVTAAGVTIPIVHTGILDVGWRTGVSWARESAQSTPNTLYVIYEDRAGNTVQQVYDIGKPFRIRFKQNEWTRQIEKLPNGAIVVAVEVHEEEVTAAEPIVSDSDPSSCPGAAPQLVKVGDRVKVCTRSDNLIVRDGPSRSNKEMFRMPPGTHLVVTGGPTCSDSSSWWQVKVPAGISVRRGAYDAPEYQLKKDTTGWVREGSDAIDEYYICGVP